MGAVAVVVVIEVAGSMSVGIGIRIEPLPRTAATADIDIVDVFVLFVHDCHCRVVLVLVLLVAGVLIGRGTEARRSDRSVKKNRIRLSVIPSVRCPLARNNARRPDRSVKKNRIRLSVCHPTDGGSPLDVRSIEEDLNSTNPMNNLRPESLNILLNLASSRGSKI